MTKAPIVIKIDQRIRVTRDRTKTTEKDWILLIKHGGDDVEKARDRSLEGRERSVDRGTTRSYDRNKDERNKDDRSKLRHSEASLEKSNADDHFHYQGLPPPPSLPPNIVPQSMASKEEPERRVGGTMHSQRLSPRHDDRERDHALKRIHQLLWKIQDEEEMTVFVTESEMTEKQLL